MDREPAPAREHRAVTWFDLACRYVDLKWPHAAAKTRTSIADSLATVTPVLVTTPRGMPGAALLREVLYGWAFHKTHREGVQLRGEHAAALAAGQASPRGARLPRPVADPVPGAQGWPSIVVQGQPRAKFGASPVARHRGPARCCQHAHTEDTAPPRA